MVPMFADKHYPSELISPETLDSYLAKGWYRMGQTIFTTHFLCFQQQFYSAIWVRLDLQDYTFRKRLRKLMRRNERQFTFRWAPGSIDSAKERLYQRYRRSFPGMLAPSLKESLLDGEEYDVYNTMETTVYEGDRLVAFSFFDLGRKSAASILGVYDPAYDRHSLGFYTMLLEIQYCLREGLRYYYPGYVVPGYQRFDYKLRIGPVDYYDIQASQWLPFDELDPTEVPITRMEHKLEDLYQEFRNSGIPCQLKHYPLFESNLFGFWQAPYFDYPVLLHCFPTAGASNFLMGVYDVRDDRYHLLQCSLLNDFQFFFNESYLRSFDRRRFFTELLIVNRYVKSSKTAGEMANYILENSRIRTLDS